MIKLQVYKINYYFQACYGYLKKEFPDSNRVNILLDEINGVVKPTDIITKMIKESPCNIIARKRELVKIKAENNTDVCIKNLVEHLKIFLQDEESIFIYNFSMD